MRIEFYQTPILRFNTIMFFEYDKKQDERYFCDVIDNLYYDKPFSFQKMCVENMLIPFDLSKDFENELTLKNWLIDHKYEKLYGNEEYEIFRNGLNYQCGYDMKINYIPMYAVYEKLT